MLPVICPKCGVNLRLMACVTVPETVRRILLHIGTPHTTGEFTGSLPAGSGRRRLGSNFRQRFGTRRAAPEFEHDQTVSW